MLTKNITLGLAQTLCTRLCHDLCGSIGAVSSGIGFMNNGKKDIQIQAKQIVEQESQKLINTIHMYRVAYGASNADSDMSLVAIRKQLKEFIPQDIKFNFSFEEGILMLEFSLAKLILCLSMVALDNIISSGTFSMNVSKIKNKKNYHITISAQSSDLNIKDGNLEVLQGHCKDQPLSIANCREFYIYNLCQEQGCTMNIQKNDSNIEYHLVMQ